MSLRSGGEGGEDEAADLLRRHRESLFPSVGLFYDEPIELRRGERQYVYDGAGKQYRDVEAVIRTTTSGQPAAFVADPLPLPLHLRRQPGGDDRRPGEPQLHRHG